VCYESRAELAKSKSCPIKITLVKNDSPETKDAKDLVIVTDAQPGPVVSCSNNSTSEQPPEKICAGVSDFFASFLIVLNAIQFAAILILVFLFHYKLKMLHRSSNCAVENVEINDTNVGYEQPRQFAKEPEPIDTEEQPEFIMYEDAQVYLQESAYASSSHHSRMPVKSQSSDTAYGSQSCDFDGREDSESAHGIRIGDIHYY
jgi:hypothetical protein